MNHGVELLLVVALGIIVIHWPQHVAAGEHTQEDSRVTRLTQEEYVTGLDIFATPICSSDLQCDEADYTKVIDALETDDQVTGELNNSTHLPWSWIHHVSNRW